MSPLPPPLSQIPSLLSLFLTLPDPAVLPTLSQSILSSYLPHLYDTTTTTVDDLVGFIIDGFGDVLREVYVASLSFGEVSEAGGGRFKSH